MSGNQSLAHRYREVAIKTANPLQLVVMLYDAAICSIQEAREHLNRKNIACRSRSLNKCIAIISELQSCLNLKEGGEIASSLDRLYDYMKRRIFDANVKQSIQPLEEIEALLEGLRSAWGELVVKSQGTEIQPVKPELPNPRILRSGSPDAMQLKSLNISI
jgi:flagellar secretion chaperone FliS